MFAVFWSLLDPVLGSPLGGSQDLGAPQASHEKASSFKAVSKASKVMKIRPNATQRHENISRCYPKSILLILFTLLIINSVDIISTAYY